MMFKSIFSDEQVWREFDTHSKKSISESSSSSLSLSESLRTAHIPMVVMSPLTTMASSVLPSMGDESGNPMAEYSSFVDRITSHPSTSTEPTTLKALEAVFSSLPVPFDAKHHPDSNVAVDEFRAAQFHYTELSVLLLVGLYLVVFVVGLIGNTLILLWIRKEKAENSLFNPFLINLCLSDHLVLITCCPLMVYTKITSLWFLGSFTCTFFHYVQGVAVTSGTLSMASVSLVRFFLIHYPISQENKHFHQRTRRLLLFSIWFLSVSTSAPLLFVRSVDTYTVAGHTFSFCLEHWQSPWMRKLFSYMIFTTVYVVPSAILLYCHLKVGFLIRSYEKTVFTSDRLASRKSFNRRGFRVKSSQGSNTNSSKSDTHPTGQTISSQNQAFLNVSTTNAYEHTKNPNFIMTPKRKENSIVSEDGERRRESETKNRSVCERNEKEEEGSKENGTIINMNGHQRAVNQAAIITMDIHELREARRSRRLNHKRKQVARLIIWTAFCFVLCWLPYNLVSLYMDVFSSDFGLTLLPFTLLLGHFHSAINPFVYWMINRRNKSKSDRGGMGLKPEVAKNVIEMRCEGLKLNSLRRESEVTSKIIAATEEKLKYSLGTSTSRRSEYF